jgi:hypothetical protein
VRRLSATRAPGSVAGASPTDAAFASLQRRRGAVLAMVAGWPPARLHHRPAPDAWSAAEVLDHLVRVETGLLAAAREGVRAPRRVGLRDRLGLRVVLRVFRAGRRVRVPASAVVVLPDPAVDAAGIPARWADAQAALGAFLAALTPAQHRAGICRHPVAGWLSASGLLEFLDVHAEHHVPQLARLAEASRHLGGAG